MWVCYAVLFFCVTFCGVWLPFGPLPELHAEHPGTAATAAATALSTAVARPGQQAGGQAGLRVDTRRVVSEGVWQVAFVTFLAYAMMPLKTWVSTAFGLILSVTHVAVSASFAKEFPHLLWQQVSEPLDYTDREANATTSVYVLHSKYQERRIYRMYGWESGSSWRTDWRCDHVARRPQTLLMAFQAPRCRISLALRWC